MLSGLGLEKRDLCLNPTTTGRPPQLEPLSKSRTPNPEPQAKTARLAFRDLAHYAEASTPNPVDIQAYVAAGWHDAEHKGRRCVAIPLASGETKYRNVEADGPKYFNPIGEGKGRGWYGLNRAARLATNGIGIHANGEASAVIAQFFGLPTFASMAGESTPPTPEMLDQVKAAGFNHIILAPDADEPGRKGAARIAGTYRQAGFTVTVHDFGPDQAKGFDLRDFCSIHRDEALARLNELPEMEFSQPDTIPLSQARQIDSDQIKFSLSYLSQLGFSPKSQNTILLILALLNGRAEARISNFLLGFHAGRILSGEFNNLELDPAHPDRGDAAAKITARGRRMWKALEKDQIKIGIEIVHREIGGKTDDNRNESSLYILKYRDEMDEIISEIRMKKLGIKAAGTELNRRARALADAQLAQLPKPEPKDEIKTPEESEPQLDPDQKKVVDFLRWLENRKKLGIFSKEVCQELAGTIGMILLDPEEGDKIEEFVPSILEGDSYSPFDMNEEGCVFESESNFRAETPTPNAAFFEESDLEDGQFGGSKSVPPLQPELTYFQQDGFSKSSQMPKIAQDAVPPPAPTTDPLAELEMDLDIPPEIFRNELAFIGEEPPETRRAIARERYKNLKTQLEQYAPNFGFPELRERFKEIFGGAVAALLADMPAAFPDVQQPATNSQLRLVG
jgi:hypothetical protein